MGAKPIEIAITNKQRPLNNEADEPTLSPEALENNKQREMNQQSWGVQQEQEVKTDLVIKTVGNKEEADWWEAEEE